MGGQTFGKLELEVSFRENFIGQESLTSSKILGSQSEVNCVHCSMANANIAIRSCPGGRVAKEETC